MFHSTNAFKRDFERVAMNLLFSRVYEERKWVLDHQIICKALLYRILLLYALDWAQQRVGPNENDKQMGLPELRQ